ncbi:hypothetical protein FDP25_05370 [Roseovarius sp. A21]|uniref:Glycosyl transferase family 2 n=1 Tax=Roseovarius bejariae TaxID=2576383 RepID=A0A844CS84_9RHOB|nr:hypothetical protein [Roseovarius bejariae]MRU14859.1 hypothetical protein [Roseovarius bejariae]
MYAISLTSIPPRFARIGPVLSALLAQRPAPVAVYLCLPRSYRRFPGPVTPPALPSGVELLWSGADLGPAGKALISARHLRGQVDRLIYCDDDWLYPPGWAAALLADAGDGVASTGQGFSVKRLTRQSHAKPGFTDIAQGFSGVCIDPAWLSGAEMEPPEAAWPVDDIWLSGQLARHGVAVQEVAQARASIRPAFQDRYALQNAHIAGQNRHEANMACIEALTQRYGLWPAASRTARAARP